MTAPSPFELWRQAGGDAETYRALLRQHGHLVPLGEGEKREPLPCGWPGRPESAVEAFGPASTDLDPFGPQGGAERAGGGSGPRRDGNPGAGTLSTIPTAVSD